MTKLLLKKQFRELFSGFNGGKKGRKKSRGIGKLFVAFLMLMLLASVGVVVYMGAERICAPLIYAGFSWLYFAFVAMLSVVVGVIGSIFTTYSSIYCAKDNDFLLSMPIPPRKIIFARFITVLITTVLYESVVLIPSIAVWFASGKTDPIQIAFTVLVAILITFFSVTLSSLLGYAVSLALLRIKHKNIVVMVFSIAFLVAYYYVYYNAYSILMSILANPAVLGAKIKSVLFYFYHLGLAADGKSLSLLIAFLITSAFMLLFFLLASKTFLRSATLKVSAVKGKTQKAKFKQSKLENALLSKEARAFFGNAHYMLNTAFSSIIMPILAVVLLFNKAYISNLLSLIPSPIPMDMLALFAAGMVFFMLTMNDITAPSISLEGKNLWIYKNMPITPMQVFKAKIKLQLLITLPPLLLFLASLIYVLQFNAVMAAVLVLSALAFELFYALLGLVINLKSPKLEWTNDIIPIKQSLSVTLTIFGGWGIVFALAALYKVLYSFVTPAAFLGAVAALLAGICLALISWLKKRGTAIFENL